MRKNKYLSWIMVFAFTFTIVASAAAPAMAVTSINDIGGHWAQSQIESLVGQGVVNGYPDGTFKPDNTITRAEFITMVNKAFKFNDSTSIDYKDVISSDWFAEEIARAKATGYISGYQDGTMKPNNLISRQEVAVIITKILKLNVANSNDSLNKFKDASSIPDWSKSSMSALVKAGLLSGYPDETVKATNSIKRAEAVVIVNQAMKYVNVPEKPPVDQPKEPKSVFDKAGTYGPVSGSETIEKDVTISSAGVILQNTSIKGNLLISEAVGSGDVTLKKVTVTGTTTIKGGGENSITLDNCKLAVVKAEKADGKLRIILSSSTSISEFVANSAVKVVGNGTIEKATINKNGVTIEPKPETCKLASGVKADIAGKTEEGTVFSGGGGGGGGSTDDSSSSPTITNVTVEGITPTVGSNASGTVLTFKVNPVTEYTKGEAKLSEDVSFNIKNANYDINGTAKTDDNLMNTAMSLLVANNGSGGVLGSTLIDNSPVTITLSGTKSTNIYTIVFTAK